MSGARAWGALLTLALVACSSDGDGGGANNGSSGSGSGATAGTSAEGGTSSSGGTTSSGGTRSGAGGSSAGSAGTGGAPVVDACVGYEAEYDAWVNGDPSLSDLAGDCGRSSCLAVLREPTFRFCVGMCLEESIDDLPRDCLECVAITVETGASDACLDKCLVDEEKCGPNEDLSCCEECLCQQDAYAIQAECSGIPTSFDCSVYGL